MNQNSPREINLESGCGKNIPYTQSGFKTSPEKSLYDNFKAFYNYSKSLNTFEKNKKDT